MEGINRLAAQPPSCPICQHVPLLLFAFRRGGVFHSRFGCLCSSVVLPPVFRRAAIQECYELLVRSTNDYPREETHAA
jgi:hypothetical protein